MFDKTNNEPSNAAEAMQRDEHTKEPWTTADYTASLSTGVENGISIQAGDDTVLDLPFTASWPEAMQRANARRIVACINACAGIPTELLESLELGELDAAVNDPNRDASHPMLER